MKKYIPLILGLGFMLYKNKAGAMNYDFLDMDNTNIYGNEVRKISYNGREFIKKHEGEVLTVYKDEGGLLTVGVGHKVLPSDGLRLNDDISQNESNRLLTNDLATAERAVNRYVIVPLNQNQYDSLVSFVFNVGVSAFANSTLLKKLNAGDYTGAFQEFSKWRFVTVNGQKVASNGLMNRREAEKDLFLA